MHFNLTAEFLDVAQRSERVRECFRQEFNASGGNEFFHLVDKFIDIRGQINKINDLTIKKDESSYEDQMTEIRRIAKCILEEL